MAAGVMPLFHAECDVAAMTYGPADDPDALLRAFVLRRLAQGHDALGVVQSHPLDGPGGLRPTRFRVISSEAGDGVAEIRAVPGRPCSAALPALGARMSRALVRRPDVIVLNRFGRREAAGAGLLGVLAAAIEVDVPVLIAVPDGLFGCWLAVAQGLAVKVAPDAGSLERWWRSLGHGPALARPGVSFCAAVK